jgi:anti-sigma-K factor RskA
MIDESKQDLLVQYLLGELDLTTADKVRAEIAIDPELRDFAHGMEEAFASLAYAVTPMAPPVELPERILRTERRAGRASRPAPQSKMIWLAVPWALAACLAIVCAVLSVERVRMQKSLVSLREKAGETSKQLVLLEEKAGETSKQLVLLQQKNAQSESKLAQSEETLAQSAKELAALRERNVLAELKISTLKAQIAAYKGTTAIVVWDKDKESGVLQLDKLSPPGAGKDYQLWVIDPKKPQPVSAGIFSVPNEGLIRTSFHPAAPVESADAFAISIEKKGGAPKPQGQIILVGR